MVFHDNVIQSLAKNTIQTHLLKFFSRTDVKCVGKEVVFHLSITIMLLFLHYCQCAVNNWLVLSVNLIRLQILLASTKHNQDNLFAQNQEYNAKQQQLLSS